MQFLVDEAVGLAGLGFYHLFRRILLQVFVDWLPGAWAFSLLVYYSLDTFSLLPTLRNRLGFCLFWTAVPYVMCICFWLRTQLAFVHSWASHYLAVASALSDRYYCEVESFFVAAFNDVATLVVDFKWYAVAGLVVVLLAAAVWKTWGRPGTQPSGSVRIDLRLADQVGVVPRTRTSRDPQPAMACSTTQDGVTLQQVTAMMSSLEAKVLDQILSLQAELLRVLACKEPRMSQLERVKDWCVSALQLDRPLRKMCVQRPVEVCARAGYSLTVARSAAVEIQPCAVGVLQVCRVQEVRLNELTSKVKCIQAVQKLEVAAVQTDEVGLVHAPQLAGFAPLGCDSDEESEEFLPARAFPAVVDADEGSKRKRPRRWDVPLAPEAKQSAISRIGQADTLAEFKDEMKEQLRQLKEAVVSQGKQKQALTEEERDLTIHELMRRLASEGWEERHKPRLEVFADRGLSEEERSMGRKQLLRHLQQEEHAAWMRTQEAQGRAFNCSKCGKRTANNDRTHQCIQTGYKGPQRRRGGVWTRDQMFVTQTGRSGLQVGVRPIVDEERLQREYQQMTKRMQSLQQQQQAGEVAAAPQPVVQAQQPPVMTDTVMQSSAPAQAGVMQWTQPQCFLQPGTMYPIGG
jgi:hypothetical protein